MAYTIRYNRATNHLQGLTERTPASKDSVSVVGYYAESACGVLTRNISGLAKGDSFESLTDAIDALESSPERRPCQRCLKAAKSELYAQEIPEVQDLDISIADMDQPHGMGAIADAAEEDAAQAEPQTAAKAMAKELATPDLVAYAKALAEAFPDVPELCRYSATHMRMGISAVTVLDCGPAGRIPACQQCSDFYARQQAGEEKKVAKLNITDLLSIATQETDGTVAIRAHESLRGLVELRLSERDARWLAADLADRFGYTRRDDTD